MPGGLPRLRLAGNLAKLNLEPGRTLLSQTMAIEGPPQVLAAHLLCLAGQPAGVALLRRVSADAARSPSDRLLGIQGLGSCGERQDAVSLSGAFKTERSPLLRLSEAGAVLQLASGDPAVLTEQSLSWAQEALGDESWAVRESAVALLGDADPGAAVPLLGKAIRDAQPEVRRSAAAALGRTKYQPAFDVLSQAIGDQNKDVRVNVLRAIGKVSTDLVAKGEKSLEGELRQRIQTQLEKSADTGDPTEQVVAAAALLRIGDDSRKDKLQAGLKAGDPELRALAVEESAADPELQKTSLGALLQDPDFGVRFRTACELAEKGDKQGVAVLKEALEKGGGDGLRAFGLLKKLGEPAAPPANLDKLIDDPDVAVRLALVEATEQLPPDVALPILSKAAAAKEAEVRRKVVERLAAFPVPMGSDPSLALPLAKTLSGDSDISVRERASLLTAKLSPKPPEVVVEEVVPEPGQPSLPGGPAESASPSDLGAPPDLAQAVDLAAPADLAALPDLTSFPDLSRTSDLSRPPDLSVATDLAAARPGPVGVAPTQPNGEAVGMLTLTGLEYVQVQIDKKHWQFLNAKPQKLAVGPHTIATMSGVKTVDVVAGDNPPLELKASPIEQGIADGVEAYKHREYEKAQTLLERSFQRCERTKANALSQACVPLMAIVSFYKGRLYEAENRPDAAANEFQRAADSPARGSYIDGMRSDAKETLGRLAQSLGLVIFKTQTDGGCEEEKLWVSPGNPMIRHGGTQQALRIRARQTVNLGECQ
jgi:HEAT repeat protein